MSNTIAVDGKIATSKRFLASHIIGQIGRDLIVRHIVRLGRRKTPLLPEHSVADDSQSDRRPNLAISRRCYLY
jgi:hypothetical protein